MKSPSPVILYIIIACSTCIVLVSLLSLIYDLKLWYFKILDFPRLQYLILAITFLFLFLFMNKKWKLPAVLLAAGLLASIVIQGNMIMPYYFGEKKVPDARIENATKENSIRVLIANVLITNKDSDEFIEIVKNASPDLVLAMEVDTWWVEELQVLQQEFPYKMEYPLDNAYGMSLYSRSPLNEQEIKFLSQDDVPSFYTEIEMGSGERFAFIGVHPVAPIPSDKYPDNVGEKEVALLKVGEIVANTSLPVIVAGDFNDVSWSHTSRLFEESGDLRNVRLGRGMYGTFDAHSPILRWPLDHFFVTKEFSVLELERLSKFGSDHFPMLAEFTLSDQ